MYPKAQNFSLSQRHTSIHHIQRCKGTQHKQSEILFPYVITIIIINNKSIIRSVWRTPISHNPSYHHNCLNPHSKQKEQYPNPPPHSPYDPVLFTPMDDVICIREERNIKTGFLNPTAPLSLLHHPLQQRLILLLILILLVCVIVLFCFHNKTMYRLS